MPESLVEGQVNDRSRKKEVKRENLKDAEVFPCEKEAWGMWSMAMERARTS